MPTSPVRGVKRPTNVVSRPTVHVANSSPKRPPANASSVLSVSSWRTSRAASRAERRADGELAVPPQQARERQVRHVGARDQQHQAGRPEQDQQHRPGIPRHLFAHAGGRRREAGAGPIGGLVVRGEAPADDVDVGRRPLAGDARLQPAEDVQDREHARVLIDPALGRGAKRARRRRHVDVVLLRVVRHVRQHADDGVRPVVHLEHLPDDVPVAAELALPVRVADDQHRRRARLVVVGHERAAEDRLDAEDAEEVRRDHAGVDAIGLAALQQVEIHLVEFDQRLELGRLVAVGEVFLDRHAGVGAADERRRLADQHQPIAVGVGQRLQEHAVDDAEDRGVRADPEPERQDREQREAAVLEQRAHAEAQVVQQLVDHWMMSLVSRLDRSKHHTTAQPRFRGRMRPAERRMCSFARNGCAIPNTPGRSDPVPEFGAGVRAGVGAGVCRSIGRLERLPRPSSGMIAS